MAKKIVVIGGVACGPKTAARIKRLSPDAHVTIIEKGILLSYAGCGLPFYISGEVRNHNALMSTPTGVVRDTHFFKMVKDIDVLNRTLVESIDRENRTVTAVRIDTGESLTLPYDELVLAVGSTPIVPDIPGIDLKGVNKLSTIEDAREIRDKQGDLAGKKAVIIGGGLIGLEVTEAFARQGMQVTIVEKTKTLLAAQLDPEISHHVRGELKASNITVRTGETVMEILGDDTGQVKAVKTDKGILDADLVLIAIGVKPNTALAVQAGLETGETGAIRVNDRMQTSDPQIYAGGDCVENISRITGKPIFAPMGSTANKHGRVIADNICDRSRPFPGVLGTTICKLFKLNIARSGLTEKQAREAGMDVISILNPSPDKAHFLEDAKLIVIKLVVEKNTRRLVGTQIVGFGDVAKRMEIAVTAMSHGATVTDIADYDLAYAPPYSPAMDNMIVAANIAENKLNGIGVSFSPVEVKEKIKSGDDFIFLDVRSPEEYEQMRIEDPRVKLIPLGKLREKLAELPKDKEIVPFCKISLRGYEAQRILAGEGFSNVKFMDGGVVCWPYEKIVNM